jgi:Tfp pilus assembly protein PilP
MTAFAVLAMLATNVLAQNTPSEKVEAVSSPSGMDSVLLEEAISSIRDPFRVPVYFEKSDDKSETKKSDLQLYSINDMHLNGVLSGGKKSRALLSLPDSKSVFAAIGDKIGIRDGKVISISGDAMEVMEFEVDENRKKVPRYFRMMISGELIPVSKKGD